MLRLFYNIFFIQLQSILVEVVSEKTSNFIGNLHTMIKLAVRTNLVLAENIPIIIIIGIITFIEEIRLLRKRKEYQTNLIHT